MAFSTSNTEGAEYALLGPIPDRHALRGFSEVEAPMTFATEGYEVLKPLFSIVLISAVVHVKRALPVAAQTATIPVSTVYLPLELRPLPRLSALRVWPLAILSEEGLLPKVVQAALVFGVIYPLL